MAAGEHKLSNINLIVDTDSDEDEDVSYGPLHRTMQRRCGSTPLHYACLLGNMKIAEVLLRNGAEWTISDGNDLLPENYASVNGDSKMQEFKRLCKEETSIRGERDRLKNLEAQKEVEKKKKLREEEELRKRQCKWFPVLLTTNCTHGFLLTPQLRQRRRRRRRRNFKKKSYTRGSASDFPSPHNRLYLRIFSTLAAEAEKKLREEEELRMRHRKWFPSSPQPTVLTDFTNLTVKIEKIIGDKMIGQRGPIRSIASAIRLRENGWVDPDRPLVMLFLGSSGIGKTELAKRLAYYLYNDESKHEASFGQSLTEIEESGAFVRIDMSEYQHAHTVSNLTGMGLSI